MSRPVRKYSIDSPNVYINTKFVEQLLDSLGISQSKVSLDLNWGRDTLRKYCTYRALISKEKREELANYFHCNPSKLINYYPTADMIKAHHDLNINHNPIRSSNDQSTIINNNVSVENIIIASSTSSILLISCSTFIAQCAQSSPLILILIAFFKSPW